jgi:hypothetical protein
MAIQGPFRVSFGDLFPHGAFVKGGVEPVRDFDKSSKDNFVQMRDKHTGELVWQVDVIDGDPESKGSVKVKITAQVQPISPEPLAGFPFAPVAFEGLTVTPYVDSNTNRLAYSVRATGFAGAKSSVRVKDAA